MAGEIDVALREELIECQRARAEFIRWKLILVAAVGSAAFGLAGKEFLKLPDLLAFIPLICIYADSVCLHNDSRIMMIGRFMRECGQSSAAAQAYEQFCQDNRSKFYNEGLAVFGSSFFLSGVIGVFGIAKGAGAVPSIPATPWLLMLSGLIGLVTTGVLAFNYTLIQRNRPLIQFFTNEPPKSKD